MTDEIEFSISRRRGEDWRDAVARKSVGYEDQIGGVAVYDQLFAAGIPATVAAFAALYNPKVEENTEAA